MPPSDEVCETPVSDAGAGLAGGAPVAAGCCSTERCGGVNRGQA